jgi:hypothetical protein
LHTDRIPEIELRNAIEQRRFRNRGDMAASGLLAR